MRPKLGSRLARMVTLTLIIVAAIAVLLYSAQWQVAPAEGASQSAVLSSSTIYLPVILLNRNQQRIAFEKWIKCPDGSSWGCQVELWTVNTDGAGLKRLTQDYYDVGPAWSPNGEYIAFARLGSAGEGIFAINYDGTNFRRISSDQRAYYPEVPKCSSRSSGD